MSWCQEYNGRLLFLMGCVVMEHISHTVFFLCSPLIVLHFYPETSYYLLGLYTAALSFASYMGHFISSPIWIKYSRITLYSKGIIPSGLASIGLGFFGLLLCQSLVQVVLTRFITGIFTGVIPSVLTEIDEICGYVPNCCRCDFLLICVFGMKESTIALGDYK